MAEVQINFQDLNIGGKTVKLISFTGQLDETNVDEEAKKIYKVIDEMPIPNLLLDFSDLTYINSNVFVINLEMRYSSVLFPIVHRR